MKTTRPFAVFDIDGTLIRWQMAHAVYDQLGRAGHLPQADYENLKAARQAWKNRQTEEGFRAYEDTVIEVIESNLFRIAPKDFEQASEEAFARYKDQVYRYTRDLLHSLKQKGYFVIAISGSPQEVVKHLVDYYGFDDYAASLYKQKDGRYTGEVMIAAKHKPELLKELVAKHGLDFKDSVGVGDSEGDISMLETVEHPLAFNPSKKLFLHAQKHHWKVAVERKNMIYELAPYDDHYRLAHTSAEE